jgi:hypothetical protein
MPKLKTYDSRPALRFSSKLCAETKLLSLLEKETCMLRGHDLCEKGLIQTMTSPGRGQDSGFEGPDNEILY